MTKPLSLYWSGADLVAAHDPDDASAALAEHLGVSLKALGRVEWEEVTRPASLKRLRRGHHGQRLNGDDE